MSYRNDEQYDLGAALIRMNKYFLKDLPHIKKYHKIRNMHQELVQKMMDFYQENPEIVKTEISKSEKSKYKLELIEMNMDYKADLMFLGDLMIYPHQINKDLCSYFLDHKKVRSAEKIKFVEAMRSSKLGMYEVLSADRSQGTCEIRNMLSGEKLMLVDEALCMNSNLNKYCAVWRVIEVDGICFQTGFNLIFEKQEMRKWIKRNKGKEIRTSELFELFKLNRKNTRIVD